MLRMFTKRQSSKSIDGPSKHQSTSSVCSDDEDPTSEFPALVLQLTAAEEQLKSASNLLVKHSNALADLVQSTADIQALIKKQFNHSNETSEMTMINEQKIFTESIAKFRLTAIAPLQSLLANFPQLKHRIDHRKSALSTWHRYQSKVDEITAKGGDATRLHRNRLKCTAAEERFIQLDNDVQRDVSHILSLDIGLLIEVPMVQLVEAQQLWAMTMQSASKHLQQTMSPPSPVKPPVIEEPQDGNNDLIRETISLVQCNEEVELLDKTRSLRPKKQHAYGTRTWHMHQHVKQSLAQGLDIFDSVKLPPGFSKEEWSAVHTIDFYNEVSLLYGTISEFCTEKTCPQMSAGPCYTYLWADEPQGTPTQCTASTYVANLMLWIDSQICDPAIFPDHGFETNKEFASSSRKILKRLFRVYAHIYHNHVGDFAALHAESHLNFCFKRFVYFVLEFDLVEAKELNALRKLISHLMPGKF